MALAAACSSTSNKVMAVLLVVGNASPADDVHPHYLVESTALSIVEKRILQWQHATTRGEDDIQNRYIAPIILT